MTWPPPKSLRHRACNCSAAMFGRGLGIALYLNARMTTDVRAASWRLLRRAVVQLREKATSQHRISRTSSRTWPACNSTRRLPLSRDVRGTMTNNT